MYAVISLILGFSAVVSAAPSTAAVDASGPKAAVKAFSAALVSGDPDRILALLYAANPVEQRVAQSAAEMAAASSELKQAAVKAFGAQGSRPLVPDALTPAEALQRIEAATVTIENDRATLQSAERDAPLAELVRVNGQWKISVAALLKNVRGDAIENAKEVESQARTMRQITSEIGAGKFRTALEAREALDKRVTLGTMPATTQASTMPAG